MRVLVVIAMACGVAEANDLARVVPDLRALDLSVLPTHEAGISAPWVVDNDDLDGAWSFDARIGVGSDLTSRAIVQGAADVGYDLSMCRVIGGAIAAAPSSTSAIAWRASATGCIPFPMDFAWVTIERVENVRPSLFDGVLVLRDPQSATLLDMHVRGIHLVNSRRQLDILTMDAALDEYGASQRVEIGIVGWHRYRFGPDGALSLRFGHGAGQRLGDPETTMDGERNEDARYVVTSHFAPVVVDNLRVVPHTGLDVAIGIASASRMEGTTRAVEIGGAYGDIAMRFAIPVVSGSVRARRVIHAAADLQLVKEDRLAADVRHEGERYAISSEAFVARQTVVRTEPGGRTVIASGAALDGAVALSRSLSLGARVEAGRTLDAVRADPVSTRWDVRATVGIEARFRQSSTRTVPPTLRSPI